MELKSSAALDEISSLSRSPVLEIIITHTSESHIQSSDDSVIAVYKPSLSTSKAFQKIQEETDEIVVIDDETNILQLQKSVINEYRKKSQFYGPLKVSVERLKVLDDGQEKEILKARLKQVRYITKIGANKDHDDSEPLESVARIPELLKSYEPLSRESLVVLDSEEYENEGGVIIETYNDCNREMVPVNLGDGDVFSISKHVVEEFRSIANVTELICVQRERIFKLVNNKEVPVTIILMVPDIRDTVDNECRVTVKKIESVTKQGRLKKRGNGVLKGSVGKLVKEGNEVMASQRTTRSKRREIVVSDENVNTQLCLDDNISEVEDLETNSFGFEMGIVVNLNLGNFGAEVNDGSDVGATKEDLLLEIQSFPGDINATLSSEDIWKYLTQYVSADNRVQGLVTQFNNESWLEVKRMSDFYQVDGEVMTDLSFKVVYRNDTSPITYFLRGFSRLLKTGELRTASDVNHLFLCMSRDRKLCLGLKPSPYQPSIDSNNQVRQYFKAQGQFVSTPFECLLSKMCRGVIKVNSSAPSSTFTRGDKTVFGVHALCRACALLGKKMNQLMKISAINAVSESDDAYEKMIGDSFIQVLRQPIKKNGMNFSDLRHFFTQNINDIISSSLPVKVPNIVEDTDFDEDMPSVGKRKKVRWSQKEDKEDKSCIGVTEDAFLHMIDFQPPNSSGLGRSLVKKCNVCQFRAPTMLSLVTHMKGHLGSLKEKCNLCQIQLSSKGALEMHKRQMHVERSPMCAICQLDFTTNDQLFDHMNKHRKHHPYECPYCSHKLTNKEAYKKHVRITHKISSVKELKFNCKTCNIYFYTPDHLLLHRINQNHEGVEPFVCKVCSISCVTANEFRHHILQHSEEERESANFAICPECYKVFFSRYRLTFHLETKHTREKKSEPEDTVEVNAQVSARKQKNRGPYLRYLRANEKYECSRCKRRFKTNETLENHLKFAHGEKKAGKTEFLCSLCGRKFNALRRLGNHMKIHSGNRPVFQCEECGQIYGKKTQVLEHIRTDHAEQVERHQQQQELLQVDHPREQQLDEIHVPQQNGCIEGSTSTSWSPIKSPFKVPTVEQTQEAVYSLLQLTDF